MKKYLLILLALIITALAYYSQSIKSAENKKSAEPKLQQEIKESSIEQPKVKFNRSQLKTYDEIYGYLQEEFGEPISQEDKETSEGIFLKASYFKSEATGNQYFVAQNKIPDYSSEDFTYFGIIAYSPEALDIGLQVTDYYDHKEEILQSNRYNPYVLDDVSISYREISVTDSQTAYGISIFNDREYQEFYEATLAKTE